MQRRLNLVNDVSTPFVTRTYRFAIIPEWVIFHPGLEAMDVRVFGCLDRYGEQPFPGVPTLARQLHCSDRTVQRSIERLEEARAVRRIMRFRDGRQTTNAYVLAGDQPLPGEGDTDDTPPTRVTGEGDTSVTQEREPEVTREPSDRESTGSLEVSGVTSGDVPSPPAVEDGFERFWELYPRHDSKKESRAKWRRMRPAERRAAIEALPIHLTRWRSRGGDWHRFVPHASTWLNQQRYEDEVIETSGNPFTDMLRRGELG